MRIQLPNGCSCSNLSVHTANRKTKSPKITMDWFISYRYYSDESNKPKQIVIKRMNNYKTIIERGDETEKLLREKMNKLKEGVNPIRNKSISPKVQDNINILILRALQIALEKVNVSGSTKRDLKHTLKQVKGTVFENGMAMMSI